jgi:hypothetical protein
VTDPTAYLGDTLDRRRAQAARAERRRRGLCAAGLGAVSGALLALAGVGLLRHRR